MGEESRRKARDYRLRHTPHGLLLSAWQGRGCSPYTCYDEASPFINGLCQPRAIFPGPSAHGLTHVGTPRQHVNPGFLGLPKLSSDGGLCTALHCWHPRGSQQERPVQPGGLGGVGAEAEMSSQTSGGCLSYRRKQTWPHVHKVT